MATKLDKIPDSAYKPFRGTRPIPAFKPLKKPPINLGKQRAATALRRQIIPDLVTSMRTFHMKTAKAGVDYYRKQGKVFQPGDEVAQLVDGSAVKPVRNVRLGGQIVYAQGADERDVALAAQTAWLLLLDVSRYFAGGSRDKKRREDGPYLSKIVMTVDGREIQPSQLQRQQRFERIEIFNTAPYSGKIERIHDPFRTVWRILRQDGWTNRVSIRLTIGNNPTWTRMTGGKHAGTAMPILSFGRLGDFTSRLPNRSDFYG